MLMVTEAKSIATIEDSGWSNPSLGVNAYLDKVSSLKDSSAVNYG